MSAGKRQNLLFIWDKLKTVPDNGRYWVLIGLAIGSEILNIMNSQILRFVILVIFVFELMRHIHFLTKREELIDEKDIKRAKKIFKLLEDEPSNSK